MRPHQASRESGRKVAIVIDAGHLAGYIGRRLVNEAWLEIDQEQIDHFADVTGDHQFIHVDPVAARSTSYGSTIAHGYLTLSLLPLLLEPIQLRPKGASWGLNYGLDRLRFLSPVPVGSAIRAASTLRSLTEKGAHRLLMTSQVEVEIRDAARPALVAETLAMWILDSGG